SDARARPHQGAIASDAIRDPPADRTHEAARDHHHRREVARADARHVILLSKERREEAREADEAAKCQAVEEGEPERVGFLEHARILAPGRRAAAYGTLFREQH